MTEHPLSKNWGMSKDIPQEIFPNLQTPHPMENSVSDLIQDEKGCVVVTEEVT